MKRVYFVRHGETRANVELYVQAPDEPLSDQGQKQALRVAERSRHIDFRRLIASDFLRAQQTAQAIADANDIEITTSPLFREFSGPGYMLGKSYDSEEYKTFIQGVEENIHNPDWRMENEENLSETFQRAKDAIAYLESLEESDVLVVTHGLFLRLMIAYLLHEKHIYTEIWNVLRFTLKTVNTGITLAMYENDYWKVLTWNDHAHFAE